MLGQIIEISEPDRYLSLEYGSMLVRSRSRLLGRVDLDNVQSVIVNPRGVTLSASLISELASRGIPVVISGANFMPVATVYPVVGHHEIAARVETQVQASEPRKKQAWRQIVQSKILIQSLVLATVGRQYSDLIEMTKKVRSGDPQNVEAQAARRYWPRLFGDNFRRDRDLHGQNAMLNYGYAVLRAATAKAIAGNGLHPSIGIHHKSATNTMRLADDFMEPFRPLIDLKVYALSKKFEPQVDVETKKMLVSLLRFDVPTEAGTSPLAVSIFRTVSSYVRYMRNERSVLELPDDSYEEVLAEMLDLEIT